MKLSLPNGFYRVSIKALILDDSRQKFVIALEDNGLWELPGGGLDWEETPQQCIKREIKEEMGLMVTEVAPRPSYCLIGKNMKGYPCINLVFETKVKNLDFSPSEECLELRFVSPKEVESLNAFRTVKELAEQFRFSK